MPLQQWPNGGRLLEGRGGQVSIPADLTRCSVRGCSRSKTKRKRPCPPKSRRRILSYPLLDFFHPLTPVCRFPPIFPACVSPIRPWFSTRPPRVAVASVPNLLCGRPIGDTNL
jgi:hypothetical protein